MTNAALTWIRANAWAWAAAALSLIRRIVKAIWASFAALVKSPAA